MHSNSSETDTCSQVTRGGMSKPRILTKVILWICNIFLLFIIYELIFTKNIESMSIAFILLPIIALFPFLVLAGSLPLLFRLFGVRCVKCGGRRFQHARIVVDEVGNINSYSGSEGKERSSTSPPSRGGDFNGVRRESELRRKSRRVFLVVCKRCGFPVIPPPGYCEVSNNSKNLEECSFEERGLSRPDDE